MTFSSQTSLSSWRLLFDGPQTGARNMAVDAAILRAVETGESPPTLRLYGWNPWCVSLGHFQKPERELDAVALRARGWDFVIRPTGGRAVLHADELTYSILARRDAAPWCATLADSYARIGEAWGQALRAFDLDMVRGGASVRSQHAAALPGAPAPPCFASSAKSELAHGDRKVVGSAQRRTRGAFVQHGSIPLTRDHERLPEVLPLDDAGRAAYARTLRAHAISLGEIGAVPVGTARAAWVRALAEALLSALGVDAAPGALTPDEAAFASEREAEHAERLRAFLEGA